MWFKTRYHLHSKEKRNGVCKHEGCGLRHDITYSLRKKEMEFVSIEDMIRSTMSLTSWRKINGLCKHEGCDSKHDTTYMLRKK